MSLVFWMASHSYVLIQILLHLSQKRSRRFEMREDTKRARGGRGEKDWCDCRAVGQRQIYQPKLDSLMSFQVFPDFEVCPADGGCTQIWHAETRVAQIASGNLFKHRIHHTWMEQVLGGGGGGHLPTNRHILLSCTSYSLVAYRIIQMFGLSQTPICRRMSSDMALSLFAGPRNELHCWQANRPPL